jgi:hypothetical protein
MTPAQKVNGAVLNLCQITVLALLIAAAAGAVAAWWTQW